MCGICSARYQQADGQALVDIMTDRLAHRGPDSAGRWNYEDDRMTVQLGFRRLSIIDLSAAADQPLLKDGLAIVYNGELYNYRALRAELATRGISFRTESDTEVVLEAWRCWGPAALSRFRGMFAIAVLDERTGELFLARDPFGIKAVVLPAPEPAAWPSLAELKALVAAWSAWSCGSNSRYLVRVDALLLAPGAALRHQRRRQAARGLVGPLAAGRYGLGAAILARRRHSGTGRGEPACRLGLGDRGVDLRAPGGRRAHLQLPVGRAGLQHHHGAGAPGAGRHRRLHHRVPPGGPAAGGDAGRRRLRPQGGRSVRHQAARDRDLPRHR